MKIKRALPLAVIGLSIFSTSTYSTIITSSTDPALTGAILENFNSVTTGDYSSLSLTGVTIVGNGAPMTVDSGLTSSYGISGQSLHNSGGTPTSFDIIFDNEVSAFGLWGGAYNTSWNFSAYDISNNLIESATITTSCCSAQFNGLANTGMSKVTLSGYGDWVIFDDLMFTEQVSAPEPTSLALLALGLVGIGFSRKKKTT